MGKKQLVSFLCGFLIGGCGMYWCIVDAGRAARTTADWLQYEADVYHETHDVPEVDSGR